MPTTRPPPVPKAWPRFVKSALLRVIALASVTLSHAQSNRRTSEVERLQTELGLVQRQLRLVSARLSRVAPRHRPHYTPTERLEILELRAARGWNVEQTAEALVTTPETIASGNRRVDEEGPKAAPPGHREGENRADPGSCWLESGAAYRPKDAGQALPAGA